MDKKSVTVKGATVPFATYEADGLTYYEFDSTQRECPEPMMNAMCGLKLVDSASKRLVMTNMQEPAGLYPRIAEDFEWSVETLESGDVRIVFKLKSTEASQTDFTQIGCSG